MKKLRLKDLTDKQWDAVVKLIIGIGCGHMNLREKLPLDEPRLKTEERFRNYKFYEDRNG